MTVSASATSTVPFTRFSLPTRRPQISLGRRPVAAANRTSRSNGGRAARASDSTCVAERKIGSDWTARGRRMPSHGFTLIARDAEQEPERVAVGGNGVGAGAPLRDATVGEERPQDRRDGGHVLVPVGFPSRRAEAASRYGVTPDARSEWN